MSKESTAVSNHHSGSGETLASAVYDILHKDILNGRLEPGSKLRLQKLRKTYDVGNSPLREALNRLSEGGMVTREENKGFRVAPISMEELDELIRTRCWLEEIAIRESIRNGDDRWEENLVLAFHRLSRLPSAEEDPGHDAASDRARRHREYHLALLSACNSSILIGYCIQLQDKSLRYRNLGAMAAYREQQEQEEHRAIHQAVLDRDADLAANLLKEHLQSFADIIINSGSIS